MTSTNRTCRVGELTIGQGRPLAIIAGPCVIESFEQGLSIAKTIKAVCDNAGLPYIFKASFDKANRSSITSYRGPGLSDGLEWIGRIGKELGVPTTTDIHEPHQAGAIADAIDLIQIPAFLCRQTDLLLAAGQAAAKHNRAINTKKGQFLSPAEMVGPVAKLEEAGISNQMLTERGTFFGYHRLVNDFTGLGDLMELPATGGSPPVCFDVTHSTQLPGSGSQTGGRPERAPLLARAATAAGVHALFIETHPDPSKAKSDGATVLPLDVAAGIIETCARIREAMTH
ncbi:MAG: 3-deoxy-8-phosphooctulonate synthase [Phycisphaerales bacterium]|nr:3-deoxy-8-phosphooctulonate synthase [Phycisphaerales bacterium]MCB9835446.1 3-deoxy-8-phosphooctulonate synthase [Phycisphaera sp.]